MPASENLAAPAVLVCFLTRRAARRDVYYVHWVGGCNPPLPGRRAGTHARPLPLPLLSPGLPLQQQEQDRQSEYYDRLELHHELPRYQPDGTRNEDWTTLDPRTVAHTVQKLVASRRPPRPALPYGEP